MTIFSELLVFLLFWPFLIPVAVITCLLALVVRATQQKKGRILLNAGQPYLEGDVIASGGDKKFVRPQTQRNARPSFSKPVDRNATDRFVLVACPGCPWAHRALIARSLLGLDKTVSVIYTEKWYKNIPWLRNFAWVPAVGSGGWRLGTNIPRKYVSKLSPTQQNIFNTPVMMYELCIASDSDWHGRITVPALWDSQTCKIICNESSQILRVLNEDFKALGQENIDLYPLELRGTIDEVNKDVYENLNNGVYRAGFTPSKTVHDAAVAGVFACLGRLEERLCKQGGPFLFGSAITEADLRLFVTLLRFDLGYYYAFRCNTARLRSSYPAVWRYLGRLYAIPAIQTACLPVWWYSIFYFHICQFGSLRWPVGAAALDSSLQALQSYLSLAEVLVFAACGASSPLCWQWQWTLGELLTTPHRWTRAVLAIARSLLPSPSA